MTTEQGSFGKEQLAQIRASHERWEGTVLAPALAKNPERSGQFTTLSGQPVERVYTPVYLPDFDYLRDLGFPGEYPFTRGIHSTMYRGQLWTMRMFAGFGSVQETNARFKYLLAHGQTGLSIAYDLPTLYGYDADAPEARGEFGKVGVGVSSLADMEVLLEGIPTDRITTSMTINGPAAIIWAMYITAAEKQGVPMERLGGTTQNDILKEYIAQKEFIFPPEPSMRLVTDTIEFAAQHLPNWNSISISGYHIREAGATAVQELAFTLANGLEYVRWALDRGLKIDDFAPRLSFFFNAHNDFFEEACKYRAARRIWAREMKETFGAKDPRSWLLRFHAQTSGETLTSQQPEINIARVAIQALAAVMGGTQSLHTNSMDEALALPSEKAATIALRTQQVIAHESGVVNTIDPLAGSYYVEWLTNQMEKQARALFEQIDAFGGVIPAIEAGYFQREIAESAFRYQREIDTNQRIKVGVNDFVQDEPLTIPILHIDPEGERRQLARLERLKQTRDNERVAQTLNQLRDAARSDANLMPYILEAVKAYATLGEITDTLRQVFGVYEEPVII